MPRVTLAYIPDANLLKSEIHQCGHFYHSRKSKSDKYLSKGLWALGVLRALRSILNYNILITTAMLNELKQPMLPMNTRSNVEAHNCVIPTLASYI